MAGTAGPEISLDGKANFTGFTYETDVGITEYVSGLQGIGGILKQRWQDFIVHEIDLDGKVLRLTQVRPDKNLCEENVDLGLLGEGELSELFRLSDIGNNEYLKKVMIPCEKWDKEQRKNVHESIRKLHSNLDSSTESVDGVRYISVTRLGKGPKRRNPWPHANHDYCRFLVYKVNRDTMETAAYIAHVLSRSPKSLSYAGTKDKRAITTQAMSVYRVEPEFISNRFSNSKNLRLGNFSLEKEELKLGKLNGNRFSIVLRDVTATDLQVELACTHLQDHGFINYFGLQRFGCTSIQTHQIGLELLANNFKNAVSMILRSRSDGMNAVAEGCRIWLETNNARQALKKLRGRNSVEAILLRGLQRHGARNYAGAMADLPRRARTMYTHSYQSLLWNEIVSRRTREFGLKVLVGDLVRTSTSDMNDIAKECNETENVESVKVLTEPEVLKSSILDVVLPLPGYKVVYPNNVIGKWYTERLAKDGLTVESLKHKSQDYRLPGRYRNAVVLPQELLFEVKCYNDEKEDLILSDGDILDGITELKNTKDGCYRGLVLEFSLPSSAYATMAVRELTKSDTSAAHQASLQNISDEIIADE